MFMCCDCLAHVYDCYDCVVHCFFTILIFVLAQYSDLRFCLNLTYVYGICSICHAVIQGYGMCMYASAFCLNGFNFNLLEYIEHNTKQIL